MSEKIPFDAAGRVVKVGDTVAYIAKHGHNSALRIGRIVGVDVTRYKPFVTIQRLLWDPKSTHDARSENVVVIYEQV